MVLRGPGDPSSFKRTKWHPPKPDPNAPTRQQEISELEDRFRVALPENIPLRPGQWLEYDIAVEMLMRANHITDRTKAQGWIVWLLRAGRLDREDGKVRLLPPEERADLVAAESRRQHLEKLRRDFEEIGVVGVP